MKKREEEMRDTNGKFNSSVNVTGKRINMSSDALSSFAESTNTRVLYFSIFSMCCLIGLATWQVFYLRRFFKAKKLIE